MSFDLAATCIGVVERSRAIDGSAARAGDVILGLAVHRAAFERLLAGPGAARPVGPRPRRAVPGAAPPDARRRGGGRRAGRAPHESMATLGEVLLTPTRIYALAVLAAREAVVAAGARHPRPRPHHRRRPARKRAAGASGRAGRAARSVALADALGHAPVRGARRARRRRAAGHLQRRPRHGDGRAARAPCRRPWPRWRGRGSRPPSSGRSWTAAAIGGARYVEGALETVA